MFRRGSPQFYRTLLLGALLLLSILNPHAEVIYDNTAKYLGNYVTDRREYGDQLDLGGTARRLTQIQFEYFGRFATNGDEAVKVRLYTNEKPYDRYRKEPTTLLYESDWISIVPGFGSRLIDNLNILLPLHTVTFTVVFKGIADDEVAGLLFYGPPTEGYSFNEFWMKGLSGRWFTILYSSSDPNMRASVGLRLIAVPDVRLDQQQPTAASTIALREGTNSIRIAQTFTANETGILSHVTLNLDQVSAPLRLRLLDTLDGRPGPNVLAARNILSGGGTNQNLSMSTFGVVLQKGRQYAIELSTLAGPSPQPAYRVPVATNEYSRGSLFYRHESGGLWTEFVNPSTGLRDVDALFQVHLVPAQPAVELLSPRPFELFDVGEPILLRAQVKPPEIGELTTVRFYRGSQELGADPSAPYEFTWTNAPAGEHNLRVVAEDTFRRPFRSDVVTINVRPSGAPENDLFARRIQLDGQFLRRIKPTANATVESGEPTLQVQGGGAGATLWWAWTAYDASPVTISAQNSSSPNSHIAVFTGTTLNQLKLVTNGVPFVRFQPQPGVTYAISVDPATRGDQVVLDLATADVRIHSVSTNVLTTGQAITVSLSGSPLRQITNVNLVAGNEFIGRSGVAPATLGATVRTNGFLDLVALATDERGIETVSPPVRIMVRPRNDSFVERGPLEGDQFAFSFSPAAGTLQLVEPFLPEVGVSERASSWWSWTARASGPVRLQLSSASSAAALAVFTGSSLSDLRLVSQNAGTGVIQFDAQAGQTYQFRVVANTFDRAPITLSMRRLMFIVTRIVNGSVTLQFDSLREPVRIEYSSDLQNWKRAEGLIVPGAQPPSWTDSGPPITEIHPSQASSRFYRLVIE